NFGSEFSEKQSERKKQMKTMTKSIGRPPLRLGFVLITFAVAWLGLSMSPVKAAPGDLYESDSNSGSIFKFTPTGTQSCFDCFGSSFTPYGLALDSSATVFVALT